MFLNTSHLLDGAAVALGGAVAVAVVGAVAARPALWRGGHRLEVAYCQHGRAASSTAPGPSKSRDGGTVRGAPKFHVSTFQKEAATRKVMRRSGQGQGRNKGQWMRRGRKTWTYRPARSIKHQNGDIGCRRWLGL